MLLRDWPPSDAAPPVKKRKTGPVSADEVPVDEDEVEDDEENGVNVPDDDGVEDEEDSAAGDEVEADAGEPASKAKAVKGGTVTAEDEPEEVDEVTAEGEEDWFWDINRLAYFLQT